MQNGQRVREDAEALDVRIAALPEVRDARRLECHVDQALELLVLPGPLGLELLGRGPAEPVVGHPLLDIPMAEPTLNVFRIPTAWTIEERGKLHPLQSLDIAVLDVVTAIPQLEHIIHTGLSLCHAEQVPTAHAEQVAAADPQGQEASSAQARCMVAPERPHCPAMQGRGLLGLDAVAPLGTGFGVLGRACFTHLRQRKQVALHG
mmetsp:Transcript_76494/g.224512  ORF Transcript_76494/g.224512 Transcript_76494/m.224512 type:complete len:205 (+) Transcript_76494:1291-1905(+)